MFAACLRVILYLPGIYFLLVVDWSLAHLFPLFPQVFYALHQLVIVVLERGPLLSHARRLGALENDKHAARIQGRCALDSAVMQEFNSQQQSGRVGDNMIT